ncbi:MAG: hypothetical protein M1814_006860 [Vezdaea aestivalis]|nr:MAG: hypothetical protein M1814_006860 [Vezdaea aestivalis]
MADLRFTETTMRAPGPPISAAVINRPKLVPPPSGLSLSSPLQLLVLLTIWLRIDIARVIYNIDHGKRRRAYWRSYTEAIRQSLQDSEETGNKFLGTEADTNIVKIYQMLDRDCANQYHYYQPGIGTYVQNQFSNSSGGLWSRFKSWFSTTTDQAVGTSFVHHVLAGYQFLMRYYAPGDHIYVFGFSRGAYTARFLCEMVHGIGLLSRGNEEMVHFAWTTFSDFQRARDKDPWTHKEHAQHEFMKKFKDSFCRKNVDVYFLGLFDCVNSVGQFEIPLMRKSFTYLSVPPAIHVRHAVSIHERRLKFKPTLFKLGAQAEETDDVKEVWFSGNHGDVGGGWGRQDFQYRLLSDTPLAWMIQEVLDLPPDNKLAFKNIEIVAVAKQDLILGKPPVLAKNNLTPSQQRFKTSQPHDMLAFGKGASFVGTLGWWLIEILPLFTRLELENNRWIPRYWPPNLGATRDIPDGAEIHPSVQRMHQAGILTHNQMPRTGGDTPTIFLPSNALKMWSKRRNIQPQQLKAAASSGPSKPNGTTLNAAKTWDSVDSVVPKVWILK